MKRYYPILLSKAGELTALANLSPTVKDEITPIIQVIPGNYDRVEAAFLPGWAFQDNELFLDFSLCVPFDRSRTRLLIINMVNGGVAVNPVLQANSDPRYISLVQTLIASGHVSNICIRFSNSSGGLSNISAEATAIVTSLGIPKTQASILMDFGLVEAHNYNIIATSAATIISGIIRQNFRNIIIGSSSFPENLSALTPANRVYRLQRFEWDIWQSLQAQTSIAGKIKYADYGTKYPFFSEANFPGTCSIKYTTATEFIIYRGELAKNHPEGNGQYIIFAGRLIASADYSGAGFSWGDHEIDRIANEILTNPRRRPGSATTWVTISQNHHITLLHSLL